MIRRVDDVLDDEALHQRHLRVVKAPGAGESLGVESRLRGECLFATEPLPLRQCLVERQRVVELHADAQLELVPEAGPVERQQEREREHEMRCDAKEGLALAHIATNQREVEELEVAEPAMDQARRT